MQHTFIIATGPQFTFCKRKKWKLLIFIYSLCTQDAGISTSEGPDNSSEEIVVEYNHNDYADLIGTFMMLLLLMLLMLLLLTGTCSVLLFLR